jgi:hypothetical protein
MPGNSVEIISGSRHWIATGTRRGKRTHAPPPPMALFSKRDRLLLHSRLARTSPDSPGFPRSSQAPRPRGSLTILEGVKARVRQDQSRSRPSNHNRHWTRRDIGGVTVRSGESSSSPAGSSSAAPASSAQGESHSLALLRAHRVESTYYWPSTGPPVCRVPRCAESATGGGAGLSSTEWDLTPTAKVSSHSAISFESLAGGEFLRP